jgi:GWxTD domain-containing protein
MKRNLFSTFLLVLASSQYLFCIDASITYATFNRSNNEPYVEVYALLIGNTLKYPKNDKNLYQANCLVEITFAQGGKLIQKDLFRLLSEASSDENKKPDLIDQRRYAMNNGMYHLSVRISDLGDSTNSYSYSTFVEVRFTNEKIHLSDPEIITGHQKAKTESQFSKNGLDFFPKGIYYYSTRDTFLKFYIESYFPVQADSFYQFKYYITTEKSSKEAVQKMSVSKKMIPKAISPLMGLMNIKNLSSGNYYLHFEITDLKSNILAEKNLAFQRNNAASVPTIEKFTDLVSLEKWVDTLSDFQVKRSCASLLPTVDTKYEKMLKDILNGKDMNAHKQFLQTFWKNRDPLYTVEAFKEYMKLVSITEEKFAYNLRKGYTTDRGYVYLRHGPPNYIYHREDDFGKYPYEIWEYHDFKANQSTAVFVFVCKSMIPNDFRQIHSSAQGENNNPNWRNDINRVGVPGTSTSSPNTNLNDTWND